MLRRSVLLNLLVALSAGGWTAQARDPVAAAIEDARHSLEESGADIRVPDADAAAAADARRALIDGRYASAAARLEPLVAPRHHTLAIRASWHRDLGMAYAGLGHHRAAQGQYRLALAGAAPDDEAFARDVSGRLTASANASQLFAAIPDTAAPGGALFVSLATSHSGHLVRFEAGFAPDPRGTESAAYSTGEYEIDCERIERRTISERRHGADGALEGSLAEGEWQAPPNALSRNLFKLLCGAGMPSSKPFDMRALSAEYRAQRRAGAPSE